MLKQILSLPTRTADAAVYVLSGILPVEAQIHIRTLVLFNNICNQADNSIEKNLARRQLIVKSNESTSWLIEIRDRPFNLKGGGVMAFCFVQKLFFEQHKS